jgi:MFS family permease
MDIYKHIEKDKQIWKFSFYGLLKNLEFFEPYLLIYLMGTGLTLFQVGILFAMREIVIYIFEIPSGIFADHHGKKRELMICFTFYMISFIIFFIGTNFYVLSAAMIFYGLGEAFRSGTHKAMIYSYLEQKGWFEHKNFVYGRTRSFSLIGSSVSSFLSIIFILNLPGVRWIFLISIIPFLIDFFLIWSYPDSLDERKESQLTVKGFFKESISQLKTVFGNSLLTKVLISSSLYDGIFKTIKDYIQPILKAAILTAAASGLASLSADRKVKVYLGVAYGIIYIFSSAASKNVYRLNKYHSSDKLMSLSFDIAALLAILLFFSIKHNMMPVVIALYFVLYVLKDARKTVVADVCGDHMNKHERATVMSIDSQLTSLFTIILAPLFGWIGDTFSIYMIFLFIGVISLSINRMLNISNKKRSIASAEVVK